MILKNEKAGSLYRVPGLGCYGHPSARLDSYERRGQSDKSGPLARDRRDDDLGADLATGDDVDVDAAGAVADGAEAPPIDDGASGGTTPDRDVALNVQIMSAATMSVVPAIAHGYQLVPHRRMASTERITRPPIPNRSTIAACSWVTIPRENI